jgi:tetratricopeptide (TPR) repeat protein
MAILIISKIKVLSFWQGRRRLRQMVYVGICVGIFGIAFATFFGSSADKFSMPSVVSPKEWSIARQSFERQYGRKADRDDLLSWMAEWYLARGRPADAVACFSEIPTSHPKYGRMARFQQGRTSLDLHRADDAEKQFRELIAAEEIEPHLVPRYLIDARQRLRHILEVELRFEERHTLLQGVVEREEVDNFEVISACFPNHLRWNGPQAIEWIEQFHAADPNSPSIRIAMGRYFVGQGRLKDAQQLLEGVVREFPEDLRAKGVLIACLREADKPEAVDQRFASLPPQTAQDSWLLLLERGVHATARGHGADALAAYEQVLKFDRTSGQAWQGVATAARLLGDTAKRARAVNMAAGLGRIQNHIGKGIQRPRDPNSFIDIADVCAEIGLDREGAIMAKFALKLAPENERALKSSKYFTSKLAAMNLKPFAE